MKTVFYEWDIETVYIEDGEECVENHEHSDRIPGRALEPHEVLVLVRDHQHEGRSWAYVREGKLDPYFRDSYENEVAPVPKGFIREFASSIHAKP